MKKKNVNVLALRETITLHNHIGKFNITNTTEHIICYSIFSLFSIFFLMIQEKMDFLRLLWLKPLVLTINIIERWQ